MTRVECGQDIVLVRPSVPVAIVNRSLDAGCGPGAARHLKVRVLTATRPYHITQAYCMKCRMMVEMRDPVQVTLKNDRLVTRGECPVRGTSVFRIGGV